METSWNPYKFLWEHWWILAGLFFTPLISLVMLKRDPAFATTRARRILSGVEWLFLLIAVGVFAWESISRTIALMEVLLKRPVILAWCGAVAGGALYLLKRKFQSFYGLIEIAFAVIALGVASSEKSPEFISKTIAYMSAVYVYIRGLENIEKGKPALGKRLGLVTEPIEPRT